MIEVRYNETPLAAGQGYEPRTEYVNVKLHGEVIGKPHRKPSTDRILASEGVKLAITRGIDGRIEIRVCEHLERR